jgi:fructuronate reductase
MNDPVIGDFIARFMAEDVTPVLTIPPGADVKAYAASLVERFRNPALKHRLEQIASDSSLKIPQRLLGTSRDRLAKGLPLGRLAFSLAGFALYAKGRDEQGQPLVMKDPMADALHANLFGAGDDAEALVHTLVGHTAIFGALGQEPAFVQPIITALRVLHKEGVRGALSS